MERIVFQSHQFFRVQTSSEFQGGVTVSQPLSCHMAQSFTNLDFPEKKHVVPFPSISLPKSKQTFRESRWCFPLGGPSKILVRQRAGSPSSEGRTPSWSNKLPWEIHLFGTPGAPRRKVKVTDLNKNSAAHVYIICIYNIIYIYM